MVDVSHVCYDLLAILSDERRRAVGHAKVSADPDVRKGNSMTIKGVLSNLTLGVMLLAITSCATKEDLQGYATKGDLQGYVTKEELSSLRSELLGEIRKAQDSARAAEENSAASAASAQSAADDARAASEKADAIFRKSVRK